MAKHPMFFDTTYTADYKNPVTNRTQALLSESEPNIQPSCFSPPLSCTTPITQPELVPEINPTPTECGTNRFLPNICHTHPQVYEDLQSNQPWQQQAGSSLLKSSYQIDYDHLPEYQLGPYPEDTKYFIRECNGNGCNGQSCCAGGLCSCQLCHTGGAQDCPGQYPDHSIQKPSKIPKSYISSGHWPEKPYQEKDQMTEYRANVGRIGSIIQHEKIHDHQHCKSPKTCQHKFFLK